MVPEDLVKALSGAYPEALARSLVEDFLALRQDVASATFGRAAPGKIVETMVQILQHMTTGTYEARPNVDEVLRRIESQAVALDDGLKICAARVARAMYALRSKRNIAHKGDIDPNLYDLKFLFHAAQWLLAELVRSTQKLSMEEAGKLIDQIQAPVGGIVEDFGTHRLVLAEVSIQDEILLLLHSNFPSGLSRAALRRSLSRRRERGVRGAIRTLWQGKMIEGDPGSGYRLTTKGFARAIRVVRTSLR